MPYLVRLRILHLPGIRAASTTIPPWPYPIHSSARLTLRKSVFLAHASTLSEPDSLLWLLSHLRGHTKRATHCMYAFRANGVEGEADGGESGSGERLARLLRLGASKNVAVVVWRWYGGVQLGSDRWRCISEVAKEALEKGGFRIAPKGRTKD
ncbi:ribosomal protein S5 domain 2-type protein [Mycena amicta]|nr:ribosomal protein S5 domain 2-type protein [Mycena amicta]